MVVVDAAIQGSFFHFLRESLSRSGDNRFDPDVASQQQWRHFGDEAASDRVLGHVFMVIGIVKSGFSLLICGGNATD